MSGQPKATSKPSASDDSFSWLEQFVKHFEQNFSSLVGDQGDRDDQASLRQAAASAAIQTLLDSGAEMNTVLELFGQAFHERQELPAEWNAALNARRFELIDKDIQNQLMPSERIELARLSGPRIETPPT